MTRWTAELVDRAQERRFRLYNLPNQRRTAIAALLAILLADLLSFGYSALVLDAAVSMAQVLVQGALVLGGAVVAVTMLRVRRPRLIYRTVVGAVLFLIATVGAIIATGVGMGFRGSILLVGGVVVIYLSAPLTLVGATMMGLTYSAVTVPCWLLYTDAADSVDVGYTLVATALAHVLCFIEAQRAQRERRVLFAQREAMHEMSTADPLTGLMNRRAWDELLDQAWRHWQASGQPLSLLMVDIDHFKQLNDTFGHAVGDRYLQAVAQTLRAALERSDSVVARYGGEEFACLLTGADAAGAADASQRVLVAVRRAALPRPLAGEAGILTVSVGSATALPGMSSPADLIDSADRGMYRAKDFGRDRAEAGAGGDPPAGGPVAPSQAPAPAGGRGDAAETAPVPETIPAPGQLDSAGMTAVSSSSSDRVS
jgi:diguanylate cyclase (GGDEF)-like protein